jgi:hypothetical protein
MHKSIHIFINSNIWVGLKHLIYGHKTDHMIRNSEPLIVPFFKSYKMAPFYSTKMLNYANQMIFLLVKLKYLLEFNKIFFF